MLCLIDDIHFLSGKDSTQEEFFHTFNDLFESGKQIFLASDRPANEISRLENRLVSRFQWGLVTDIQPPDYETRLAILKNKAATMNLAVDDEILDFLAEKVSRNVRRMEGALTRIASYDSLIDSSIWIWLRLNACSQIYCRRKWLVWLPSIIFRKKSLSIIRLVLVICLEESAQMQSLFLVRLQCIYLERSRVSL